MAQLIKLKSSFFDRSNIAKMLDRKKRKTYAKFGAFTRIDAQRSMRQRKGASKPGSPPNAHERKLLRKLIFFAFVDGRVVVGPILKQSTARIGVPRLMEHGGIVARRNGSAQHYPQRAFMEPAGMRNIGKLTSWYAKT